MAPPTVQVPEWDPVPADAAAAAAGSSGALGEPTPTAWRQMGVPPAGPESPGGSRYGGEQLLFAVERKHPPEILSKHLLECPQDASDQQDLAAQLQQMLQERNVTMEQAFLALDADGSGSVSHKEFREGLRALGIALPHAQMKELLMIFDEDNDGEIDYQEFMREFLSEPESLVESLWGLQSKLTLVDAEFAEQDLTASFAALDWNGDGSITHEEFRAGLRRIGVSLPKGQVDELIRAFDADGDGVIEYCEFVREFGTQPHELQALLLERADEVGVATAAAAVACAATTHTHHPCQIVCPTPPPPLVLSSGPTVSTATGGGAPGNSGADLGEGGRGREWRAGPRGADACAG
jgi:Ca2+-binding EF-hand superfamily protein